MALFGKDKEEKGKKKATAVATAETAENTEKKVVKSKDDTGDAFRILVRPVVSEKSQLATAAGKYIFAVSKKANKISVRNAIEKVYDVKVVRVNMLNVRGKARTYGKTKGRTSEWKKAIVTLKKGQMIGEVQV